MEYLEKCPLALHMVSDIGQYMEEREVQQGGFGVLVFRALCAFPGWGGNFG